MEKTSAERGFYLYPDAYGLPEDKGIAAAEQARAKAEAAKASAKPESKKDGESAKKVKTAGL